MRSLCVSFLMAAAAVCAFPSLGIAVVSRPAYALQVAAPFAPAEGSENKPSHTSTASARDQQYLRAITALQKALSDPHALEQIISHHNNKHNSNVAARVDAKGEKGETVNDGAASDFARPPPPNIVAAVEKLILAKKQSEHKRNLSLNKHSSIKTGRDFWDICDQVTLLGFGCEHHTSVTEDGFELDIVRIPPQPAAKQDPALIAAHGAGRGYPLILQHGLIDSASAWVANYYPRQNLGCMLSSAGYDVFMPNARGNSYSMRNRLYSDTMQEYWERIDMDFMAKYDMPANIRYVLNATGRARLSYVGHSQGGMMGFAAFSTWHPSLAAEVDYFFALAPACYVHHTTAGLIRLLAGLDVAQWLELLGVRGFLEGSAVEWLVSQLCPVVGVACALLLDALCGVSQQINTTQMAVVTRYTPGGTSVSNMAHWAQEVRAEGWATHDFGAEGNLKYWGTPTNPAYTANAMTGPRTVVFYGDEDALADPTDVETLLAQVPASVVAAKHLMYGYAHLDFTWGVNAHIDIYPIIMRYLGNLTAPASPRT